MNQEIKQKWIEALRSGKYEQGKGILRNENNKFSALGVLCDISKVGSWQKRNSEVFYRYMGYMFSLPPEICEKFNIKENDFTFFWKNIKEYFSPKRLEELFKKGMLKESPIYDVAYLNDFGATFEELADLIEKYL